MEILLCLAALSAASAPAIELPPPARPVETNLWHGFRRTVFEFEGRRAWIVEPDRAPAEGAPWTWTMQWAEAFVPRTGVLDLLKRGWRHATIETFDRRMDEEGLRVSREFQRYLVEKVGFAPKANLVGMSWGGFFSTRYAAAFPDCVSKIYLDAPLLAFSGFSHLAGKTGEAAGDAIGPWAARLPPDGEWPPDDPEMPVNMASRLAGARIPVLLVYGAADDVVPPDRNCEVFAERYRKAGGIIGTIRKEGVGHHPHGLERGDSRIAEFFASPDSSSCVSR